MKHQTHKSVNPARAFTLIELTVLLATVTLIISLVFPALAHAHIKNAAAQCLSNYRRLQIAWEMYREDHNDYLLPNAPAGTQGWINGNLAESWNSATANTNVALYTNGLIWPYLGGDISLLRCPADILPSANGFRLRSTSMNGQVAYSGNLLTYNSGYRTYLRGSDLSCPNPNSLFVFVDESIYSLNDGLLVTGLNSPVFPDLPANYHAGAGGFSFADGHAVIHPWTYSTLLNIPYTTGVTGNNATTSGSDPDWLWLTSHSACSQ